MVFKVSLGQDWKQRQHTLATVEERFSPWTLTDLGPDRLIGP
jgi:hypothetical protein